jgi:2-polyprenyl-3-methyl-5-hydroxy-6-metoxy-1,4-benzoquinol methylase
MMEESKLEQFTERVLSDVNAAMSCLNLYIGHRLDLFKVLQLLGDTDARELAEYSNYNERYLKEWLECMAAGAFIDHDPETGKFSIPPEHALALTRQDNPSYMAAFLCWVPSLAGVINPLIKAFRTGEGVPYEAYGEDGLEAIGLGNKPMFINDYVNCWIPAMQNMKVKLESGARVADIGCGFGWSSISLAKGFPKVKVDAYDSDRTSINQAHKNALNEGVSGQLAFYEMAVEDIPLNGKYDLITAFECLHDMAYPQTALRKMKEMLADDGAVLISEEAVGDNLEENKNFLGHLMYNFSVLHCLPQSMVFPESAAIGTVFNPSRIKKLATEAGFTSFEVLPVENYFWRFYQLKH